MTVLLKVKERAVRPRSLKRELRKAGQIPAVVYGNKVVNTAISVDEKELMKALKENGQNAVYTLDIDGKKVPTLIFAQQQDTFNRAWLHVEFLAVDMDEKTELEAELVLKGTPAGVKVGGVLGQNLYTVIVSATPDKLPERVEVDVTALNIGEALTVADISKNADYTIMTEADEQIAVVLEAVDHEAEENEAAAEVTPEVIGEKKES